MNRDAPRRQRRIAAGRQLETFAQPSLAPGHPVPIGQGIEPNEKRIDLVLVKDAVAIGVPLIAAIPQRLDPALDSLIGKLLMYPARSGSSPARESKHFQRLQPGTAQGRGAPWQRPGNKPLGRAAKAGLI